MKLRSYLLLFSLVLFGLSLGLLTYLTREALDSGFDKLREEHERNIAETISASLEAKKRDLLSLSRILRSDNDLASLFVLSRESQNSNDIRVRMENIRSKVRFDVLDVLSPDGVGFDLGNKLALSQATLADLRSGKTILKTCLISEHPTLLAISSLELYDRSVGILVVGHYLDLALRSELAQLTRSRIKFYLGAVPDRSADAVALRVEEGPMLYSQIELPEGTEEVFGGQLARKLTLIACAGFAVLLIFFHLFIEVGFTRRFGDLVSRLETYIRDLGEGKLGKFNTGKPWISEVNLLGTCIQKLAASIEQYQSKLLETSKFEAEAKRQRSMAELASQVAHDIRSPLSALNIAVDVAASLPEDIRLIIRGSVGRITDIANSLLIKHREYEYGVSSDRSLIVPARVPLLASSLIDYLVTEKRTQYRDCPGIDIEAAIGPRSYGVFVGADARELKRAISNLCTNAVEAIDGNGRVELGLIRVGNWATLYVRDTGRGIPAALVAQLGTRGATFGKRDGDSGTGLGLYHARQMAQEWGGALSIESTLGVGTTVSLRLPTVAAPSWFASTLTLVKGKSVVILDDDHMIHAIWERRFKPFAGNVLANVVHLRSPAECRAWLVDHRPDLSKYVLLFDHELMGHRETGLDLICEYDLYEQAVLVTSRFEQSDVQQKCSNRGLRMIPKQLAPFVPIQVME